MHLFCKKENNSDLVCFTVSLSVSLMVSMNNISAGLLPQLIGVAPEKAIKLTASHSTV